MNCTKEKLERYIRHWDGESINDQLAGREPTPMVTLQMREEVWDKIWEEDVTEEMYEVLKIVQQDGTTQRNTRLAVNKILAKIEGV